MDSLRGHPCFHVLSPKPEYEHVFAPTNAVDFSEDATV